MTEPFHIRVFDRTWNAVHMPAGAQVTPLRWSSRAVGGPDSAEVRIDIAADGLSTITEWLGYQLTIVNDEGAYLWWGDIEEMEFNVNGVVYGLSLTEMVNRLMVRYTVFDPGGGESAGETAWAQDATSMSLYGTRERQHSTRTPMRLAQAERMRDTLLAQIKNPIPVLGQLAGGAETFVLLRGTGFWKRLSRVYYTQANGLTEFLDGGTAYPLGLGFASEFTAAATRDKRYAFHQLYGRFRNFKSGTKVRITGSTSNNGLWTVTGTDDRDPVSMTRTDIFFEPNDDIRTGTGDFGDFESGDVILISGSSSNNGTKLVKTPGTSRIEVSPGYQGGNISTEGSGPSVNILRGNSIQVEQVVTNEHVSANVWTVTAQGQKMYQTFVTGSAEAWALDSVEIRIRKIGTPTDGVEIRLYTDSGSSTPGAWLATATVDDADISGEDGGTWTSFVMDSAISLSTSTIYGLQIQRTGTYDAFNFYEVWFDDDAGYTSGACNVWDGVGWMWPDPSISLQFRLLGAVDTALQVQTICESINMFSSIIVEGLSGLETNQWRDGSQLASVEAEEMLQVGDGTNTRLLASTTPQRGVVIRPQPAPNTARYLWRGPQDLCDLQGARVMPGLTPAGHWCHLDVNFMPYGAMAGLSPFFIEAAEYAPDTGWMLQAQGQADPWAIGEVLNG